MAHDPVRDEAERLVAAAIAAVSFAARGLSRGGARPFANGSDECCICPVCRLIASMRDPSAEMAERLASGAGDLAAGVASMLRAFSRPSTADETSAAAEGDAFWESLRQRAREAGSAAAGRFADTDETGATHGGHTDPWRVATTTPPSPPPMAKKAVKKAVKKAGGSSAPGPADAAAAPEPTDASAAPKPVAKKATKRVKPRPPAGEE